MSYLTPDQLLENASNALEELDVEAFGGTVKIRELTAHASTRVHQGNVRMVKGQPDVDIAAVQKAKFLHGVVEPKLTAERVNKLHRTSGSDFTKVVKAIDRISGLDEESKEEAEAAFQD